MIDYKVSDLDDSITHFTLLSYCDLVAFDDVVKESKWRLWMLKLKLLKKKTTLGVDRTFKWAKDH